MSIDRQHRIVGKFLYIFLSFFFLYSLWYQYAFNPISGVFQIFGILILACSLMNIRLSRRHYKEFRPILIFVILIFFTTAFFSRFPSASLARSISILEYLIPMFGIFIYVDSKVEHFQNILKSLSFTITVLAISSIFLGHQTNTGAIAVGSLNVNVEASLLAIGFVSNIILLGISKTSIFRQLLLFLSIVLCFKAEIDCASRRGFVVAIFVIGLGSLFLFQKKFKGKPILKYITFVLIAIVIAIVGASVYETLLSSVLFSRFSNTGYMGDTGRTLLKRQAFQLFLSSPLFGVGVGAVEKVAGYYSHSFYYELLGCTGFLGFAIMLYIMLRHFFKYARICICYRNTNSAFRADILFILKGMLLLIGSILIGGVAVVFIYDMYFYIMIGMLLSADSILSGPQFLYLNGGEKYYTKEGEVI